jgi:signal transduction histidine kinase
LVAGVAGGVAERIGVPDVYVRAAFVTLTTVWGIGILLYLLIWWLTLDHQAEPFTRELETGQRVGLGVTFVAVLWLLAGAGFVPDPFATFVTAAIAFGVAAVLDRSESRGIAKLIMPGETQGVSVFRMVAGVLLLLIGLGLFFGTNRVTSSLGSTFIAIALTAIGLLVAFGPWFVRMRDDLGKERLARARQEERAEMAAHLHDSVLQTLALIQRTEDPRRMSSLARTQERELRTWLFGKAPQDGMELLSTALAAASARIEDERAAAIDLVTVGDARLDGRGSALVAAATEAMVNAIAHSGSDRVSVYLEVGEGRAEVWITDQGKGFDRSSVPGDRKGLAESIEKRIARQGGTAVISSRPGEGTEVHLVLPGVELVTK